MRKVVVILVVVASVAVAGFMVYGRDGGAAGSNPGAGSASGNGRGMVRAPMAVNLAASTRADLAEHVLVVGNLIGAATVLAVPKVNGRLESVSVKLGDQVRRGQTIAKIEDREIREQVRQAEATYEVSRATIRQREADLKLAATNLERNRTLLERQLLPRQTYDDTEARYQSALAQVDLSKAQFEASKARLDELRINLANTVIVSPVDGFVGKRFLDAGAFVSPNAPVASLVDIRTVRMVGNLVEKDMKRVTAGTPAEVEVDAFPGETFEGKVSRVAPVFDPATRTAEMEIEVPNPGFRLKPGMYARVQLTVGRKPDALVVPATALVNLDGRNGVFVASPPASDGRSAGGGALTVKFQPVEVGLRDGERIEITSGLTENARVVTTGAGALKDGDRVLLAGGGQPGGGRRGRGQGTPRTGGSSR